MKKKFIIKSSNEFDHIINNGKKINGKIITLYYYPSDNNKVYFGFAVGKKIGNAVDRNKVKRKIRMIVHNNQFLFSNKYKYIIMLRKDCLLFSHDSWEKDLVNILGKVNENEKN